MTGPGKTRVERFDFVQIAYSHGGVLLEWRWPSCLQGLKLAKARQEVSQRTVPHAVAASGSQTINDQSATTQPLCAETNNTVLTHRDTIRAQRALPSTNDLNFQGMPPRRRFQGTLRTHPILSPRGQIQFQCMLTCLPLLRAAYLAVPHDRVGVCRALKEHRSPV